MNIREGIIFYLTLAVTILFFFEDVNLCDE